MNCNIKEQFESAVKVIQKLPKNGPFQPSQEMSLRFYAFYKQATKGECKMERPGFWDPVGKAKWDSWSLLGDMTRVEAMQEYTEQLKQVIEAMPHSTSVEEFIRSVGNFYVPIDEAVTNIKTPQTRDMIDMLIKITEDETREGDSGTVSDISGNGDFPSENLQSLIEDSDLDSEQDEFCDTIDEIDVVTDLIQKTEAVRSITTINTINQTIRDLNEGDSSTARPTILEPITTTLESAPLTLPTAIESVDNSIIPTLMRIQKEIQEMKTIVSRIESQRKKTISFTSVVESVHLFFKNNFPQRSYMICSLLLNFVLIYILIRKRR